MIADMLMVTHSDICKYFEKTNISHPDAYTICEDELGLFVNINTSFDLPSNNHPHLGHLPFRFGTVDGFFNCSYINLTTLFGAPTRVETDFYCNNNKLDSLEYFPQYVGRSINCVDNKLSSFVGISRPGIHTRIWCDENYFPPEAFEHLFELGYDHNLIMSFISSNKIDFATAYRQWNIKQIIQ